MAQMEQYGGKMQHIYRESICVLGRSARQSQINEQQQNYAKKKTSPKRTNRYLNRTSNRTALSRIISHLPSAQGAIMHFPQTDKHEARRNSDIAGLHWVRREKSSRLSHHASSAHYNAARALIILYINASEARVTSIESRGYRTENPLGETRSWWWWLMLGSSVFGLIWFLSSAGSLRGFSLNCVIFFP